MILHDWANCTKISITKHNFLENKIEKKGRKKKITFYAIAPMTRCFLSSEITQLFVFMWLAALFRPNLEV